MYMLRGGGSGCAGCTIVHPIFGIIAMCLTLVQLGKGRSPLAYMSLDSLHASHKGLPGWIQGRHNAIKLGERDHPMYFYETKL